MKWEYVKTIATSVEFMNEMGQNGWELVASDCGQNAWVCIFKRPLPEPLTMAHTHPIGARIRELRRKNKLTLEDAAKVMVCTIPEASAIERDKREPTGEQLHALEKLFNEAI